MLLILFTGCTSNCGNSVRLKNDDVKVRDMSETIIECFINKDIETLKSMFCPIILSLDDIDEQIQGAFDFIDGEIISYDIPRVHAMHKQNHEGITTLHYIRPNIRNIESNLGKTYEIRYYSYLANTENNNRIGLSLLRIISACGKEEYDIGDYYLVNPELR